MRFWCRRPFASPSPIRPEANLTTIQIDNAPAQGLEASSLDEKLERLEEILGSMGGTVLIGYSGGVDSAMLAVAAHRVLGKRAIAVTADSESYADGELERAVEIVEQFGIPHEVVHTREIDNPDYASNPINRCYFCKSELFIHMGKLAEKHQATAILYGQNADDVGDFRPGATAAHEYGVRAPLMEAGMSKDDVRQLAKRWGVPVWNRPAMACLSSRFPYGTAVTSEGLRQVDRAERFIKDLICEQLRVRHHDHVARIELPADELTSLVADVARRRLIADKLSSLGYRRVTLDVIGFRSGSMNEALGSGEDAPVPDAATVFTQMGLEGRAEFDEQILCLQLEETALMKLINPQARMTLASELRHTATPYVAFDLTSGPPTA